MTDRFTEAFTELTEKNSYICDTCTTIYGHDTITQRGEMRGHQPEGMGSECMYDCDPMPFGD